MLLAHLIEDRRAAEVVAPLEEHANQVGQGVGGADGIPQSHPRSALHRIHDEPASRVIEDHRLVAQVDEVGRRRALRLDGRGGRLEVGVGRGLGLMRRVRHEARERKEQHDGGGPYRGTKKARRFPLQLELPPEILRVLHVLEREEAEPRRRDER